MRNGLKEDCSKTGTDDDDRVQNRDGYRAYRWSLGFGDAILGKLQELGQHRNGVAWATVRRQVVLWQEHVRAFSWRWVLPASVAFQWLQRSEGDDSAGSCRKNHPEPSEGPLDPERCEWMLQGRAPFGDAGKPRRDIGRKKKRIRARVQR